MLTACYSSTPSPRLLTLSSTPSTALFLLKSLPNPPFLQVTAQDHWPDHWSPVTPLFPQHWQQFSAGPPPETSLTYHGLMHGLCICQNPNKKWTAHSRVTEENFIKENSSLGEGLIAGSVALRKELIHHQEKAQLGRSQDVSPSPSPPALQLPDGFPIEWNHQEDRGKETGWCSPLKSSCWTLNRGKREFVFWKAAEFICLAS